MGLGEAGWTVLGTRFRCRGLPAAVEADLAALLQGFSSLEGPEQGEAVEIQADPATAVSPQAIEYRLINEAIARARDRWVLHAGAVAGPRGTCLVIGPSGAGKTSLTLWLWSGGLGLVTDDLCPIAQGSLLPERFARALHMDGDYSPRLLARIPPRPPSYPAEYYPFPEPAGEDPPPVSDLLVLERGADELAPLTQSEAAHKLLAAVIKSPEFDFSRAIRDMVRLADGCRAHRLRSSTLESAGEAAMALLARGT